MTGLNKEKRAKRDKVKGPRIRHPSGQVYLDVIFKKEEYGNRLSSAAQLYQNILEYSMSKDYCDQKVRFKIRNIGYWLLKHNPDFRDFYANFRKRSTTESNKLNGISKRIKRYLDNLEEWGLIERLGLVDAETRNGQKTVLYGYTNFGYIIACVLEYLYKEHKRERMAREIFDLIQLLLTENFFSYMTDFLTRFYAKCMEKDLEASFLIGRDKNGRRMGIGIIDYLIIAIIRILSSGKFHFPRGIEYFSMAQEILLTDKKTRDITFRLFSEVLRELPEDIRNKFMAHEKAEIESRFARAQPTKDWVDLWFKHMNDHDLLALYAVCKNNECTKQHYPVLVQYYHYRAKLVLSENSTYILGDCYYCRTKNSVRVFNSYEHARSYMNEQIYSKFKITHNG
jgi:hypothetical protein